VSVRNFRCYASETRLDIDSFTTIIGANDVGKSTLLDALAIFFGDAKADREDASVHGDPADMSISCTFDDLPASITIDATNKTTLSDEYLLNEEQLLEIRQTFNGTVNTPKAKTVIRAVHPSTEGAEDLLSLKRTALKQRCRDLGVDLEGVNQNVNAELRSAIRAHIGELEPVLRDIEVDQDGAKEIFPKILAEMPSFFLFRVDRPGTDQDAEAQNPMKVAVKLAINQQSEVLSLIETEVLSEIGLMVNRTLEKLNDLAPDVAAELEPQIADPKWESVFKIGLRSDDGIPINKRGSGVRRLLLLAFLQAQVESIRVESPDRSVLYAIEEPETGLHPNTQRALLAALREVSEDAGFQVIMTTHTSNLVRYLPADGLRFVQSLDDGQRVVHLGQEDETKSLIRQALGVHPDHDVRLFVGVEGKNDEDFLIRISAILSECDDAISPLGELVETNRLVFIPLGGSSLTHWVARLKGLQRPEFYIFDRDTKPPASPRYAAEAERFNGQTNSEAVHTSKRELENYLHPAAIRGVMPEFDLDEFDDFDDVPTLVAKKIHEASESPKEWHDLTSDQQGRKISKAKRRLNTVAVDAMDIGLLHERDPDGDVVSWLRRITELAVGE